MSNGYEVQLEALRRAALAADSAAEQVSAADLASALGEAVAGLPGARCARAVEAVGEAWRGDLADWASQARGYGQSLTGAADGYARNDAAVAQDFHGVRIGEGAP
ncbi:type VII secretion target [Amycolatopsis lurida]